MLGFNEPELLKIFANTFKTGDPSYAGPLASIALGLRSFHILELKEEVPEEIWTSEMALAELQLDDDEVMEICKTMKEIRGD